MLELLIRLKYNSINFEFNSEYITSKIFIEYSFELQHGASKVSALSG